MLPCIRNAGCYNNDKMAYRAHTESGNMSDFDYFGGVEIVGCMDNNQTQGQTI